ncbi:hypothetical protein HMI55_006559 [Coelomomyces lativittatus]|nr:hypothetical protein HMI55_006559 [Coelomomyces lativittatus]
MGPYLSSPMNHARTHAPRFFHFLNGWFPSQPTTSPVHSTTSNGGGPSTGPLPLPSFSIGNSLYFGPHFILRTATPPFSPTHHPLSTSPTSRPVHLRDGSPPSSSPTLVESNPTLLDPELVPYWERSRRETTVGPGEFHSEFTTLQCLVNIQRSSVHLVKSETLAESGNLLSTESSKSYILKFEFDSLAPCTIQIFWLAKESEGSKNIKQLSPNPFPPPHEFTFPTGLDQHFELPISHAICFDQLQSYYQTQVPVQKSTLPEELPPTSKPSTYTGTPSVDPSLTTTHLASHGYYPLILNIQAHPMTHDDLPTLSEQRSYFILEGHEVKMVKQTVWVQDQPYLLQDIFGLTDSDPNHTQPECIVCMAEMKDTIVLPCRHLCLCKVRCIY